MKMLGALSCFLIMCALTLSLVRLGHGQNDVEVAPPEPNAHLIHSGGPLKAIRVVTQDTPVASSNEGNYAPLSNANTTLLIGPGSDLLVVTFSAECRLFNAGPEDWVEVRVVANGVPLEPNDTTSPTVFCAERGYGANSLTFARRVVGAPTTGTIYRVSVEWRLRDFQFNNPLSAGLDDYTMYVQLFE